MGKSNTRKKEVDMDSKEINKLDVGKIAMGIAVAIVFILQQWHAMKLDDMKTTIVPRSEYQRHADTTMDKDDIMEALSAINNRLNIMEKK